MAEIRVPSGWLALALVVWALATTAWPTAIGAAVLCEMARMLPLRWAFTVRHFERLADLTSVGFAALATYQFITHGLYAIYGILREFPLCLLPLLLLQIYSTAGRIPRSALVMSLRRRPDLAAPVDLRPIFGAACLLAASTGGLPPLTYGSVVGVTLAILIIANRAPRHGPARLLAAFTVIALLAGLIQLGLVRGQQRLGDLMQAMFGDLAWTPVAADHTYTALGTLGRLKLSDRIRLRITTSEPVITPLRLTEARYQRFQNGIWRNHADPLTTIDPAPSPTEWRLDSARSPPRATMSITTERTRELGAVALPAGAQRLASSEIVEVRSNELGTVVAETRPGFVHYEVQYEPDDTPHAAPTADDLAVPEAYRTLLNEIADEAGIRNLAPARARTRLEIFFNSRFRYSLVQRGYYPGRAPLAEFLRETRHGHCEYFATASTLLLRTIGVPARYTVGYMTDEYSTLENAYVARARHAHAWVEAFIDQRWRVVDTTPSRWLDDEASQAPVWQLLGDLWAWQRWQWQRLQRGELALSGWLLLAVPMLLAWLAWRLRHLAITPRGACAVAPGTELDALFKYLARHGQPPRPGDTARRYLHAQWPTRGRALLEQVLQLYYRQRYGGAGLAPQEHAELRRGVTALVADHVAATDSRPG